MDASNVRTGQPRTVALDFITRWIFAWVGPDADHRPTRTPEPVDQWHARICIGLVLGLESSALTGWPAVLVGSSRA
jgi:hypothetical protein